ncbi:MAG: hypothetical protein HY314_00960 [Acidobacteria bacterium]|nr:hypothetical protein [Acidobacteriota bacterium]
MNSELDSKEEILRRAVEFGVDLSLLRERLKLSPTERLELHKQALLSFESFVREVKRARRANSC